MKLIFNFFNSFDKSTIKKLKFIKRKNAYIPVAKYFQEIALE